ncbi:tetratricopeptide repeat protein [Kutzneria sp. 744]|uniref:tetratricopeptide repeat protein n=1 Tax=Kutzneria sp. (strain 744) TaxID=345341 RepID=UPI0003EED1B0|nr:tetratricopeptide repeat protein [Kutzneria sp. 744]EWM11965.1 tetratricopeptide repeat protein [Kutzneria sp. 744]
MPAFAYKFILFSALPLLSTLSATLADSLLNLGETYHELGRLDEARDHVQQALELMEAQRRLPDAERTRALLDDINRKLENGFVATEGVT